MIKPVSRRTFLKLTGLTAVGGAIAMSASSAAPPRRPPNIILILADDLGYGDLGCYGQRHIRTPNTDQMAAEGMRFTRHYAGSTVCAPSRACLLTGLHTGHAHMRGNGDIALREDPQDLTIATRLREAGYRTAMIGKSSVACHSEDPALPNRKGFDHFFGYLGHGAAHHYFPRRLVRNGEWVEYPDNHLHEGAHYSHDLFLAETRAFLASTPNDRPYFLFLSMQIPHASLYAPEEWKARYRGMFADEAVTDQGHYRNEDEPMTTYAAMVSRLDWEVGRILEMVRARGQAGDTLVLFTSDNGSMNEGGYERVWFESSGGLRGGKRDLYEGGVRVPLIAWWPGTVPAAVQSDHVSAFWDFFPTACQLAGLTPPAGLDGISYAPALLGNPARRTHEWLYWEFHEEGGKQAVRMGRWKGIRLRVKERVDAPIELYDLEADPEEKRNLAPTHPAEVDRIRKIMDDARTPHPLWPLAVDVTPE